MTTGTDLRDNRDQTGLEPPSQERERFDVPELEGVAARKGTALHMALGAAEHWHQQYLALGAELLEGHGKIEAEMVARHAAELEKLQSAAFDAVAVLHTRAKNVLRYAILAATLAGFLGGWLASHAFYERADSGALRAEP